MEVMKKWVGEYENMSEKEVEVGDNISVSEIWSGASISGGYTGKIIEIVEQLDGKAKGYYVQIEGEEDIRLVLLQDRWGWCYDGSEKYKLKKN